jgi:hypothetical protein
VVPTVYEFKSLVSNQEHDLAGWTTRSLRYSERIQYESNSGFANGGHGITRAKKSNPSNADIVHVLIQMAAQFSNFCVCGAFLKVDRKKRFVIQNGIFARARFKGAQISLPFGFGIADLETNGH